MEEDDIGETIASMLTEPKTVSPSMEADIARKVRAFSDEDFRENCRLLCELEHQRYIG